RIGGEDAPGEHGRTHRRSALRRRGCRSVLRPAPGSEAMITQVTLVPPLSAEQLAPIVRRVLDASAAWPVDWSCEPLDVAAINPTTGGLYRVAGTAQTDAGPLRPWRVILKVLSRPDLSGTPLESGYAVLPEDWNYWRREVLAFRSGLLERFTWP